MKAAGIQIFGIDYVGAGYLVQDDLVCFHPAILGDFELAYWKSEGLTGCVSDIQCHDVWPVAVGRMAGFSLNFSCDKNKKEGKIEYLQLRPFQSMKERGNTQSGEAIYYGVKDGWIFSGLFQHRDDVFLPLLQWTDALRALDNSVQSSDATDHQVFQIWKKKQGKIYHPSGSAGLIESVISAMGFDPPSVRNGRYTWQLTKGSAMMHIALNPTADWVDVLVRMVAITPQTDETALYQFLMKENYRQHNVRFTLYDNEVVSGAHFKVKNLDVERFSIRLTQMLENCDEYDNQFVMNFNAGWIEKNSPFAYK